jgi:hypothetical protein
MGALQNKYAGAAGFAVEMRAYVALCGRAVVRLCGRAMFVACAIFLTRSATHSSYPHPHTCSPQDDVLVLTGFDVSLSLPARTCVGVMFFGVCVALALPVCVCLHATQVL